MNEKTADAILLRRCLNHDPGAWNDFVDRYLSLIYRVVHFTAHHRSVSLSPDDVEDLVAEVLLQIVAKDYAVLRQFQGRSRFSTYLTVVARRCAIHGIVRRQKQMRTQSLEQGNHEPASPEAPDANTESLDEVHKLLAQLPKKAREAVRLYFSEGRTYEEISQRLNIPVNSIGPLVSRAKQMIRKRMQERLAAKRAKSAPTDAPLA